MFVRAYLRASTKDQDASRAEAELVAFAQGRGLNIAATYRENESGASLRRPELFRMLADCQPGDIILVEQVDRLSRLNDVDWELLKDEIRRRQVKVVALDLPTSHLLASSDEFTAWMLGAINGMLLDMLAAIARKDYVDRKRRQQQGTAAAKKAGKYKGRKENAKRNAVLMARLERGDSWSSIIADSKASRSTLSRLRKRLKGEDRADPAA